MLWPRSERPSKLRATPPLWEPLRVVSTGICCSVGHDAPSARAAISARMNHFRETSFVSDGRPLVGAMLYEVELWGSGRLKAMFSRVWNEAIGALGRPAFSSLALVMLVSEPDRPGSDSHWYADTISGLVQDGQALNPASCILPLGKGGIATALQRCAELLLAANPPGHVVLVSVDSFFTAASISHFLEQGRIKTASQADGFIPGEAAAAITLSLKSSNTPALWIEGTGSATEDAPIGSDRPVRAIGLTRAIRAAEASSGCKIASLCGQVSGVTGESWYFREAALALVRTMDHRAGEFAHLPIARSIGETGAASSVVTLAWLAAVMGRSGGPGDSALLHFGNDEGNRSAIVVRHRLSR